MVNKKGASGAFFVVLCIEVLIYVCSEIYCAAQIWNKHKLKLFMMRHSEQILFTQRLEIVIRNL